MDRLKLPLLECVAVCALLAIAVSVVALFVPSKFGDLGTWAGAIGTFLAFTGTIWVATFQSRERSAEELLKARLHIAGMSLRLVHVRGAIGEVCRELFICTHMDRGFEPFKKARHTLTDIEIGDVAQLVALAPLPGNVAVHLAEAADQIRMAIRLLERAAEGINTKDSQSRREFANGLHSNLCNTANILDQSISYSREAARALYVRRN